MSKDVSEYWGKTVKLTSVLLVVWFLVSFVLLWFAEPLSKINFFGWPLSFYMAAQGCQLTYLFLIWFYAKKMGQLDEEYGFDQGDAK